MCLAQSAFASDSVLLSYGPLNRAISIDALENFAKTGTQEGILVDLAKYTSPESMQQIRKTLQSRVNFSNVVVVSQFLYTPQGEKLLSRLGQVIRLTPSLSGDKGIRASLILSVSDKQNGLTLINVLRKFPSKEVYLDFQKGLSIVGELDSLIRRSQQALAFVNESAKAEATQYQAKSLKNLSQPGSLQWNRLSLEAPSSFSNVQIPFYLYLPKVKVAKSQPLVVVYPGLGAGIADFTYLADQLASYGFVVLLPNSPGSDRNNLVALVNGATGTIAAPDTFIRRPGDITDVLNHMERLAKSNSSIPKNIDFKKVGMIGHSYGGYATLALVSGGSINFSKLEKTCQSESQWNVSLLLQCEALKLPRQQYKLNDARIKAAIAINPVDSSILGEEEIKQIQVPIMLVGGSADTVAPALEEQIVPFTWLTSPNKYLVLINNAGHTAVSAPPPDNNFKVDLKFLAGSNPKLAQTYMKSLSVAFFKTHIANQSEYSEYLNPAYIQSISQAASPIGLLRSLDVAAYMKKYGSKL